MNRLLILFVFLLIGCSQVSPHPYKWQIRGDAFGFQMNTVNWTLIKENHLGRVACEFKETEVQKLAEKECIEISLDEAMRICPKHHFKDFEGLTPYLIRGVSYSEYPTFSIVKINKDLGWVYVYQATYNGEIYIPGVKYVSQPSPIVVFLSMKPQKIYSAADVGGDMILGRVNLNEVWWSK